MKKFVPNRPLIRKTDKHKNREKMNVHNVELHCLMQESNYVGETRVEVPELIGCLNLNRLLNLT